MSMFIWGVVIIAIISVFLAFWSLRKTIKKPKVIKDVKEKFSGGKTIYSSESSKDSS